MKVITYENNMESKKVKEIKKALEQNIKSGLGYEDNDKFCNIMFADILTLINELESEKDNLYNLNQNLISDKQVIMSDNERLKKDNELLRNAKVVYETVDYCYEDLKKAQDRIAELEKELTNDRVFYKDGICYPMNCQGALKQFAERLKEKGKKAMYIRKDNQFDLLEYFDDIDETLKEFIE